MEQPKNKNRRKKAARYEKKQEALKKEAEENAWTVVTYKTQKNSAKNIGNQPEPKKDKPKIETHVTEEFEITTNIESPYKFTLKTRKALQPGQRVMISRRYESGDPDDCHPMWPRPFDSIKYDRPDDEDASDAWGKGIQIQAIYSGYFFAEVAEYDEIRPRYWLRVTPDGTVSYLPGKHPVVKLGKKLVSACAAGDLARVRELLRCGVNPNTIIDQGWGALMTAAKEGHYEVVKELIEWGADIEDRQNWIFVSPLQMVSEKGQRGYSPQIAQLLVAHGADGRSNLKNLARAMTGNITRDPDIRKAVEEGEKIWLQNKVPSLLKLAAARIRGLGKIDEVKLPQLRELVLQQNRNTSFGAQDERYLRP